METSAETLICTFCSSESPRAARFCSSCGRNLRIEYAGFWIRFVAWMVDAIILSVLNVIVGFALIRDESAASGLPILMFPVYSAYFVGFWAVKGATPGKMAVSVEIRTVDGERIGIGQSLLRYVGYFVSAFIFFVGYLMIAFTKGKRGLHDYIAGSIVAKKS